MAERRALALEADPPALGASSEHRIFLSDKFLQQLLQPNLLSLRGFAVSGLGFFGRHPKREEVVEPLFAAAGNDVFARRQLPCVLAAAACSEEFPAKVKLASNYGILASCETVQRHHILAQAVQHCYQ